MPEEKPEMEVPESAPKTKKRKAQLTLRYAVLVIALYMIAKGIYGLVTTGR